MDNAPVVSEFLPNATTCSGMYTGCAVCSTASALIRYGKSIPRLADGTPSMRTLGSSMGAKHRAAVAGNRHGLSLSGQCSPPQSGTNWCAYCAYLELKARGLPVGYAQLTDAQILSHLKAGHTLVVPGLYREFAKVAVTSYSATNPAHGRSDPGFDGWHMVAAHGVSLSGTTPVNVIVTDSDFGSSGRPVVPPHSLIPWATFLRYYHRAGWGIAYVNAKPTIAPAPAPPLLYRARVHPPSGYYFTYEVVKTTKYPNGEVVKRNRPHTGGWSANCLPKKVYPWPAMSRTVELVQIADSKSPYNKLFIPATYSDED